MTGVRKVGREEGFAMLFVIFAIMVLGILGALVLLYTSYALNSALGVTPASRAQAVAEIGLDVVHAKLASELIADSTVLADPQFVWGDSGSVPRGSYTYSVTKNPDIGDGDPYDWLITAQGEYTAMIEGVERTFYRQLEEVLTFAGGRYYSALDYVLFSKEGTVDLTLTDDLSGREVAGVTVNGNIYAGQDVLVTSGARFASSGQFEINGNIITESGDILISEVDRWASASNIRISGGLYSGITASGGSGGGVELETSMSIGGGGTITLTTSDPALGCINSHGQLRDHPYGVYIHGSTSWAGSYTSTINGDIHSDEDVYASNAASVFATIGTTINGSVFSSSDVEFRSIPNIIASVNTNISGSIYADGNVTLYGNSTFAATILNRVGGDIQAGGDVYIYEHFGIGCGNPSGYQVGGNIYGRNVTLDSQLGALGTISNRVSGNIYCSGGLDLDNRATLGTSTVTIGGSIYTSGNFDMYTRATIANARTYVNGAMPGLLIGGTPSVGCYSNGGMVFSANSSSARITVTGNAKRASGAPTVSSNVTITGTTSPAVGSFAVPAADPPQAAFDYPEVPFPECDFDFYREKAKSQEAVDGQIHYYGVSQPNLNIPEGMIASSEFVVFVDGDMGIESAVIPPDSKGVFVCTGNVIVHGLERSGAGGIADFQIITKGTFSYSVDAAIEFEVGDRFFIYAAHDSYDAINDPVSVEYEVGWFRGLEGQITARGDIVLVSTPRAFENWFVPPAERNYTVTYKSPSVLSDAFRIPFTIKRWKEL
ncbi:MAG: hypothetical protein A2Y75_05475 [Candidatus Solincola sediminis]|uniref:Uncharacterized protein n=1 Tax=Candidatus Solincola sediminis TaxID=1797199 RepID=A0A1F2WFL6_9ACTN|nr:MAG: hypothetical protein A2Y75_05475 [Candidatus Solincola sediminis]